MLGSPHETGSLHRFFLGLLAGSLVCACPTPEKERHGSKLGQDHEEAKQGLGTDHAEGSAVRSGLPPMASEILSVRPGLCSLSKVVMFLRFTRKVPQGRRASVLEQIWDKARF